MRRPIGQRNIPLQAALHALLISAAGHANAKEAVSYRQIEMDLPRATDADRVTSDGVTLNSRFERVRALNRTMRARAISEVPTTGLTAMTAHDPGAPGFAFVGAINSSGAVFYRIPALDQTAEGLALLEQGGSPILQACRITIDFDALPPGSDYSTFLHLRSLFPDPECRNQAHSELRNATVGDATAYRTFASAIVDGYHVAVIERSDDKLYAFNPVDAVRAVLDAGTIRRAIPLPLAYWHAGLVVLGDGDTIFFTGPGPEYEFERVCAVRGLPWAEIVQWRTQSEQSVRRYCDEQLTLARWAHAERARERWKDGTDPPIYTQPIRPLPPR
ncbi:MAG TPA: hypothetical protein VI168_02790 [Croceibacterium sp.]